MNYIGSKHRLLPFLERSILSFIDKPIADMVFCDLFAGTGRVGRYFKTKVKSVIANDLEFYSYVLIRHYIGNHKNLDINKQVDKLNSIKGKKGFVYTNYCKTGSGSRNYFADENGLKIDACRDQIEQWYNNKDIDTDQYFYLLASLLESADKVANIASVYGAYLKHIKKSALKPLVIVPAGYKTTPNKHTVCQQDANALIQKIEGDILYLDPPYNARQYGSNYHLLNTIAANQSFVPKGVTGLPNYNRSAYCSKRTVLQNFEELIAKANFKYIFLSYNNEGLMSHLEIENVLKKYGVVELRTQNYQRFKADKTENRNHKATETKEYLFCLKKS